MGDPLIFAIVATGFFICGCGAGALIATVRLRRLPAPAAAAPRLTPPRRLPPMFPGHPLPLLPALPSRFADLARRAHCFAVPAMPWSPIWHDDRFASQTPPMLLLNSTGYGATHTIHVPVSVDTNVVGAVIHHLIERILHNAAEGLERDAHVASEQPDVLEITGKLRFRAWPAIEGITIPEKETSHDRCPCCP